MKKDKQKTEVVFLIARSGHGRRKEAVAYFPNVWWNKERDTHACYMHNGQHGGCFEGWAAAQSIPRTKYDKSLVAELKAEMENGYGYNFNVLDAQQWRDAQGYEPARKMPFSWYRETMPL